MNLLIDSGNTFTKAAICNDQSILEVIRIDSNEGFTALNHRVRPNNVIISSVNKELDEIMKAFPESALTVLSSQTKLPIQNFYKTPTTLGVDRIAGIVGATVLCPEKNCLCIDVGSCITYDLINDQKHYFGGSISLGIEMRFKALNTFTAKLPLVERTNNPILIGRSTEEAIQSGVLIGVIMEMQGIIDDYKGKYADLAIIITGGDAIFFESKIKGSIFVEPNLLFIGLKRILEYNVS